MAVRDVGFQISFKDYATALLADNSIAARAHRIAEYLTSVVPGSAAAVYLLDSDQNWMVSATAGDVSISQHLLAADTPTLAAMAQACEPQTFGPDLLRENYSHLDIRRTLVSLAVFPLATGKQLLGAVELISFDEPLTEEVLMPAIEALPCAAAALAAAAGSEEERGAGLQAVTRLSQLYDLEKVFNSTLELDDLLPIVTAKARDLMQVQAINLWMLEPDESLRLMNRNGFDPTIAEGALHHAGESIPVDVSDTGEPLLIDDPDDDRLRKRNASVTEGAVFSVVVTPLMVKESLVGVIEAINKLDGKPFDDDDLFLLTNICDTAANALNNASLLQAERKLQVLQMLVDVSREITSTLNLDRVLQTVVNGPQPIISFDRCAIALPERSKLLLKAVSGSLTVNRTEPDIARLEEFVRSLQVPPEGLDVVQHEDRIEARNEEERESFRHYFEASGMRAFHMMTLADDQERLGFLTLESHDPDFLTDAHREVLQVIASQATVALRNAQLYREVPFIDILEPLLERKRRFMALDKRRRQATIVLAAACVLFLAAVPLPLRLSGPSVVAPLRTAHLQSEVEGVVKAVHVREGDSVKRGTVLADLEDWDYRAAVAAAKAKNDTAIIEMNRALAANDGAAAGVQSKQAEYWSAELDRAQERLNRTHLRSPIDGVVATPHLETTVGRRLQFGDTFADIVDTTTADLDVAIDGVDESLLRPGQRVSVKLEAYPTRIFRGRVNVVSPTSAVEGDQRVYFARVSIPNLDSAIRAGMQGQGKVWTGWNPAGYVIFRRPAMWLWEKIWWLLGW